MALALEQARKAWGDTHPNPMVGAVIVENDEAVATGYHKAAGQPHAEVDALQNLGRRPAISAAFYVSLEPCCVEGRTPPCTLAILDSGIRKVYIGTKDPNPDVAGKSIRILRDAGIEVHTGFLEDECRDLNLLFNHWITKNKPLIAGKVATTIDGRTATHTGHSKWITSEAARQDVMRWRRLFPAIAVGAGTVLSDDPNLTSRLDGEEPWCPLRFVFDSHLKTWPERILYTDLFRKQTTIVTTESAPTDTLSKIEETGINIWQLPAHKSRPSLQAFRDKCAEEDIIGVFVEGGSHLLSACINSRNLDYLFAYRAPKILGDSTALPAFQGRHPDTIDEAITLAKVQHASFGNDHLVRGVIHHP